MTNTEEKMNHQKYHIAFTAFLGCCSLVYGASPEQMAKQGEGLFQAKGKIKASVIIPQQAPAQAPSQTSAPQGGGSPIFQALDALDERRVGLAARFIPINPGQFTMGSPDDEKDHKNDEFQRSVTIAKGFEMQATEVTQLQYVLVMGKNPSHFKTEQHCDGNYGLLFGGLRLCINHPVETLLWEDTQEFIEVLNKVQDKYTYRLPSEEEWEYAARSGVSSVFPYFFGLNETNELDNYGWHKGNSANRTHAVASKKPNPWGLYDMYGNVWEWTTSHFYGDYTIARGTEDPLIARMRFHIIRGGCLVNPATDLRSANRYKGDPLLPANGTGFRLVRQARKP